MVISYIGLAIDYIGSAISYIGSAISHIGSAISYIGFTIIYDINTSEYYIALGFTDMKYYTYYIGSVYLLYRGRIYRFEVHSKTDIICLLYRFLADIKARFSSSARLILITV